MEFFRCDMPVADLQRAVQLQNGYFSLDTMALVVYLPDSK